MFDIGFSDILKAVRLDQFTDPEEFGFLIVWKRFQLFIDRLIERFYLPRIISSLTYLEKWRKQMLNP